MNFKTPPPGKYAWTVKVGEKGQFVIPKEARDVFDIHPGDTLIVLGDIERGLAILPKGALDAMHRSTFEPKHESSDKEGQE